MLNVPQIAKVKDKNLSIALQRIVDHVNLGSVALRFDPSGTYPAPSQLAGISVVGGAGHADIQITDNSVVGSGDVEPITYFVEYSTDPNFINPPPYQVQLGAARNAHIAVPAAQLHFRAYSQHLGSLPSPPVVFGGQSPTLVDCTTGTIATLQTPQGSGSNPPARPGGGFGRKARFAK